jgi:uncharacterized membrane protein
VMGFAAYMTVVEYVSAQQGKFQVGMFGFGFGLLFILLGNYLPKLPRNFFFGIRSPWTLASETVWKRTHILSGWLFVAAGCLMAGLSFTSIPFHILLLALILPLALFSAVIYPYYLYRKIQKGGGGNLPEL